MYSKFDKKRRYLIACSGGPDSMALLDMYHSKGCYVEAAHVNYHKRDTATRDEKIVDDYCSKNNITFNKLDVYPSNVKGNFQAYARKARYEWFSFICKIHNLDVVLVAHQQDDLIETYLMQKSKKLGVSEYGLSEYNDIYGAHVYRPLLDKTKQELINYCDRKHIEYGIDESNLTDNYTRNRIRHSKVEKMSVQEREDIICEMIRTNIDRLQKESESLKFIYGKSKFTYDEFFNFPYLKQALRNLFDVSLSDKYLDELIRQLRQSESFKVLKNNIYLVKEYGYIEYFKNVGNYSFKVKKGELFYTDYFKIQRTGKDSFSCVKVSDEDYPLTIRNYRQGDSIVMKYGTKKINRFFIDNKIGLRERLLWPVVFNKNGTAILVPGLGCSKDHYDIKPNLYVIKL